MYDYNDNHMNIHGIIILWDVRTHFFWDTLYIVYNYNGNIGTKLSCFVFSNIWWSYIVLLPYLSKQKKQKYAIGSLRWRDGPAPTSTMRAVDSINLIPQNVFYGETSELLRNQSIDQLSISTHLRRSVRSHDQAVKIQIKDPTFIPSSIIRSFLSKTGPLRGDLRWHHYLVCIELRILCRIFWWMRNISRESGLRLSHIIWNLEVNNLMCRWTEKCVSKLVGKFWTFYHVQ